MLSAILASSGTRSSDQKCRHDDITYQSIANAFGLGLKLHDDALRRMKKLSKPHPSQPNFSWDVSIVRGIFY